MPRVLIADDDPVMRMLLSAVINAAPDLELVAAAEDATQAIELADAHTPDVVLLDVEMPGGGGPHAARAIRATHPRTKILALSAHESGPARDEMQQAGADGYVIKGAPPAEIAAALRNRE
jgi:DNA-binding NarL/FixJ family response regulator